jgi:uncharacterized protein YpbB
VAVLIENGMIELQSSWVAADRAESIKRVACELGFDKLKPIKEALPEDYTYDEIRLVAASLRQGWPGAD